MHVWDQGCSGSCPDVQLGFNNSLATDPLPSRKAMRQGPKQIDHLYISRQQIKCVHISYSCLLMCADSINSSLHTVLVFVLSKHMGQLFITVYCRIYIRCYESFIFICTYLCTENQRFFIYFKFHKQEQIKTTETVFSKD